MSVEMSGFIEDVIDAGRKTWDRAKEETGKEADRLKEKYAARRRERMMRLVLVVGIAYLLTRD